MFKISKIPALLIRATSKPQNHCGAPARRLIRPQSFSLIGRLIGRVIGRSIEHSIEHSIGHLTGSLVLKETLRGAGLLIVIVTMNACQSTSNSGGYTPGYGNQGIAGTSDNASLANLSRAVQRVLLQADKLVQDNRWNEAEALLNHFALDYSANISGDRSAQQPLPDEFHRRYAKILQQNQKPLAAQNALGQISDWGGTDFLLLGQLCEQAGQHQCSADGYIQATLALGLDHPDLPTDINDLVWQHLSRAGRAPAAFVHRYHHAWWRLQQDLREAGSISAQQAIWQRFQRRNPSHPASIRPPQNLTNLTAYQTPNIGLFLPLSGRLEQLGAAVRDGFVAAHLAETAAGKVTIYDTEAADLAQLWEQALLDGIDVAVGPLTKTAAARFAQITDARQDISILLLNYLDQPPAHPDTFQVGIAIEDEASALAQHVLLGGYSKLLVVHSGERWALRARNELESQWPHPITYASFQDVKDVTAAVGEAMQVAASEARRDEIANILGEKLEFAARARKDLDAIISLTDQVQSRALIPALRFHYANDLPVYATSQTTKGDATDKLAGFKLTQMPLFVEPSTTQTQLLRAFDLRPSGQADLVALGFDAFRVASWLPLISNSRQLTIPAATGYLWLDENRAFKRDLPLAKVTKDGTAIAE